MNRNIRKAREYLQKGDKLNYSRYKNMLPLLVFPAADFDLTPAEKESKNGRRKKGQMGKWRVQKAVHLSGLYMVDFDHIENPEAVFASWWEPTMQLLLADAAFHQNNEAICKWAETLDIALVHITPSGKGLRVVAIADKDRGNLADNASWLSSKLGMKMDESCKDATRGSFCPCFEDILYINNEKLFNHNDEVYNLAYVGNYRGGVTRPSINVAVQRADGSKVPADPAGNSSNVPAEAAEQGDGLDANLLARVKEGYHGKSYEEIVNEWFNLRGGKPQAGDRHKQLLLLAFEIRHIADNDPKLVEAILTQSAVGREIATERGQQELTAIASDACAKPIFQRMPKRIAEALQNLGVQLDERGNNEKAGTKATLDYNAYWKRLRPLLSDSPGLREACAPLNDHHKIGGVLVAGAMLGTYLSRCWWEHFDGKYYRLSFLTYVIGAAASGKSFLTDMDELIFAPLQSLDKIGRKTEEEYNNRQRSRKANEALPDRPTEMVRYCPSSTSNATFYRRLKNAVDKEVIDPTTGEPIQLHLVTVESELATALRSQVGNWAGKGDLELKAFHNEKAGVDYSNVDSTNGIMQVNWNQIISGTMESFSRKVKPSNILDGLVTRLAVFPMPDNDYVMIEKKRCIRNHERESYLRSLGYDLEKISGELKAQKLVDYCYDYEEKLCQIAKLEGDETLDYFRKRIPVIMMRYALVRMVLRQLKDLLDGATLKVEKSDLDFARLIGDFCLEAQIYMFGSMVAEARQKERTAFLPRKILGSTRNGFNKLPKEFTAKDVVAAGLAKTESSARVFIMRLRKDGLVAVKSKGVYTKNIKAI